MNSPYANMEERQSWRKGVSEQHPMSVRDFHRKKYPISPDMKFATAGSCFAPHALMGKLRRSQKISALVTSHPVLRKHLRHTSGGRKHIDFDAYDVFVTVGLTIKVQTAYDLFPNLSAAFFWNAGRSYAHFGRRISCCCCGPVLAYARCAHFAGVVRAEAPGALRSVPRTQ
ncbi:hypothetical protein SAMN04488515_1219 [Cognatiyoonia koreensis]|uniref:Uncharacterized protein n=1 Tax=Cognatiyoonia koreensis TaxID=364200 RepID=A0A1I0PI95_9RHOB|nr:hypothetical protein [Cognatiyoonia koreensis]SEW13475.1 hypothetical protein SAMN04488515_1219 [Cognatiyoonia koreensis]